MIDSNEIKKVQNYIKDCVRKTNVLHRRIELCKKEIETIKETKVIAEKQLKKWKDAKLIPEHI
jgi:hypothetical protein